MNHAHPGEAQPTEFQVEQQIAHGSPKLKHMRLDRKDGHELVKDTTPCVKNSSPTEATATLELMSEP